MDVDMNGTQRIEMIDMLYVWMVLSDLQVSLDYVNIPRPYIRIMPGNTVMLRTKYGDSWLVDVEGINGIDIGRNEVIRMTLCSCSDSTIQDMYTKLIVRD